MWPWGNLRCCMPYMLALAQKTQLEGRVSDSQKGEYTVKYAEHTGSNPARMGGVVCAWYVKRDSQCNEHINAHNAMTLTTKIQRQGCTSWSHSLLNAKGNFLNLNLKNLIRKSVHSSSTYLWPDKLLAGGTRYAKYLGTDPTLLHSKGKAKVGLISQNIETICIIIMLVSLKPQLWHCGPLVPQLINHINQRRHIPHDGKWSGGFNVLPPALTFILAKTPPINTKTISINFITIKIIMWKAFVIDFTVIQPCLWHFDSIYHTNMGANRDTPIILFSSA